MVSTPEMSSCLVYKFIIFYLSLQASMAVRATRSLDLSHGTSSLRSRSLLDLHDDSMVAAQVKPEKLPQKDRLSETLSEKLMARQMGSKPPNCDGKCNMCQPCEAVEVPISNRSVERAREASQQLNALSAQPDDTNYMPESWRCACGNEYYNP